MPGAYGLDLGGMQPEAYEHFQKVMSPAHVAQYVTKDLPPDAQWRPARHLQVINQEIVAATTDTNQTFLNVAASFRHGKSELISRYLPVWFLGHFPDRQVILVSYNEDKAAEWGEFARNVMEEYGPELFGLTVDKSSKAKTYWKIKGHRGAMRSVGVGGSLTGLGGDLICMDDPLKNREEADSPAARETMWLWYGSTLRTRLQIGGTLILTMARWHEDDLTGKIKQNATSTSDPWRYIEMPAIAEAPAGADLDTWRDLIGRKDGEPLWPEKWPLPALLQLRDSIGSVNWNSLAQQNPTPPEGKLFKVDNWLYRPEAPAALRSARFWDTASTKSNTADWTVGVKMGLSPMNEVYVLDVVRFREGPGETEKRIVETARLDGTSVPIRMEQGKAGEGKTVVHNYKRVLLGYDFDGIKPDADKETRAAPYATQQGNRNVHLVGSKDNEMWRTYVEEHRVFPSGRHDDQVDASSGAFNFLADSGAFEMQFATPEVEQAMQAMMARGFSFSR